MAFSVDFYIFNKKSNSTLRPSTPSASYNCTIKRGSGLIAPKIELNIGLTTAPSWNYCYIANFGRFYYISEWYNENALWIANLKCDVLATYKLDIGSSSLYALRTSVSSLYDGRVVDTLYPTKVNSTFDTTAITTPWESPSAGCFVVGVVSKVPHYGSINYYVLTAQAMQDLIQGLLDNTITDSGGQPINNFNLTDASEGLQLALVDPLQYIKSAIFLPFSYANVPKVPAPINVITVFNYPITVTAQHGVIVDIPQIIITKTFTIKKHPQTTARGNYVNTSPYTNVTLTFPPFGTIEIDTTVICNATSLTVEIRVDTTNGLGILEVQANGILLNRLEAQVGVPVQLSQVTRDYMGAFNQTMSAASSIASGIGGIMTGNVAGGVGSIIGGVGAIGNAAASLVPRSQSIGSGGTYATLYETPRLDFQFFELVDDDIDHNGRPCCKMVTPSNNAGYYLIQDGDVGISGTQAEAEEIRRYLESGFYYE